MERDGDLRGTASLEIVRTYVLLQLWADARMPQLGLETFEFHLLFRLRSSPGRTQAELGRRVSRNSMSVSRLVRSLEARGLVRREASTTDARAHSVTLTRKGDALVTRVLDALDFDGPLLEWSR